MPLHFRCDRCRRLLSIGRRKAGMAITCPICHSSQNVPFSGLPESSRPPNDGRQDRSNPKGTATTRLAGVAVLLVLFGMLAAPILIVPSLVKQSNEAKNPDDDRRAERDLNRYLPVVQEAEAAPPRDDASRLLSPPPAPRSDNRPAPDPPRPRLPQPDDVAPPPVVDEPPKKKPPAPPPPRKERGEGNKNRGDAELLGEELADAKPQRQEAILQALLVGKGSEYTQAIAAAIPKLSDEIQKKARAALLERLERFTSKTLLAYLAIDDPEIRRAAVQALGNKEDGDHIGELIELLEDPDSSVVAAAHEALTRLTKSNARSNAAAGKREGDSPTRVADARAGKSEPRGGSPTEKGQAKDSGSKSAKTKPKKKDDDVPDVSLAPPEEGSTEIKALVRVHSLALFSKKSSERIQAARALGGLGEQGMTARRHLCAAMLDPVVEVRVAAADALKSIDPKMHYLAVVLALEKIEFYSDISRIDHLLNKIQKLEEDGEPLTPLVAQIISFTAKTGAHALLLTSLTTMTRIGRRDLFSYRVVFSALNNRDPAVRAVALRGLARMKHGKLAVPKILSILRVETPANRIAALDTLAELADESTEEIIAEAISKQRYHADEDVRRAVDAALNKLENKQNHVPEDSNAK